MSVSSRIAAGFKGIWGRLARARDGGVAMMFALALPPICMMAVCGVDIHRASTVRAQLQDALDAAALAAARSTETTDAGIRAVGMRALRANLAAFPSVTLREAAADTDFDLGDDGSVTASARANVDTLIAHMFLGEQIGVGVTSVVLRSSKNVEVALVLDTTGSMAGQRIVDLRAAAADLVNIVVQDVQTPFYSKVALVPYSMAVNVGDYADAVRGTTTPPTNITGASWAVGLAMNITGATRANPVVITAPAHGFSNGDWVWISGVGGMTQINNRAFQVANRATNTFQLSGVNGSNYSNFSSGGTVRRCQVANCEVVITSASHGLSNGERVYISGVGGMTQINNDDYVVGNRTTNTFSLGGMTPATSLGTYTSGGSAFCTRAGCRYYAFTNPSGASRVHPVSTCVTERNGSNAFTDAAPSSTLLGRNYPSAGNACLSNRILPLSSDRAELTNRINQLQAAGSTAGHVGVAWGWYLVSPRFGYLWPSASRPAAYGEDDVLKAVVIMTDGEYNSAYCNGVIAQDSTSGSGSASDHINCNAPNGHSFDQTMTLCDRIKAAGVIVYTVGLNVVNDPRARNIVSQCATSTSHAYYPNSGADLRSAFRAIGQDIASLRIAR